MTDGWTYGAELEWPDVDVRTELPDGWAWSRTDYTVVNSDGTANDPKHELVLQGGELNTPVCNSPEELGSRSGRMRDYLQPGHNYRSNLHIHVQAPELEELGNVKKVAQYTRQNLPRALPYFDSLDGLLIDRLLRPLPPEELAAAEKRKRHSERSRHFFISDTRHAVRMEAKNLESFLAAEVPHSRAGVPQWHLASREAVNLRSLRKHGTVEFRCFAGDEDAENVHAAACFARDWLKAALNDTQEFGMPYFWQLPKQVTFSKMLEDGWAWTNLQHNRRDVVKARLALLGKLACSSLSSAPGTSSARLHWRASCSSAGRKTTGCPPP